MKNKTPILQPSGPDSTAWTFSILRHAAAVSIHALLFFWSLLDIIPPLVIHGHTLDLWCTTSCLGVLYQIFSHFLTQALDKLNGRPVLVPYQCCTPQSSPRRRRAPPAAAQRSGWRRTRLRRPAQLTPLRGSIIMCYRYRSVFCVNKIRKNNGIIKFSILHNLIRQLLCILTSGLGFFQ